MNVKRDTARHFRQRDADELKTPGVLVASERSGAWSTPADLHARSAEDTQPALHRLYEC
jgi:hypothetical protein